MPFFTFPSIHIPYFPLYLIVLFSLCHFYSINFPYGSCLLLVFPFSVQAPSRAGYFIWRIRGLLMMRLLPRRASLQLGVGPPCDQPAGSVNHSLQRQSMMLTQPIKSGIAVNPLPCPHRGNLQASWNCRDLTMLWGSTRGSSRSGPWCRALSHNRRVGTTRREDEGHNRGSSARPDVGAAKPWTKGTTSEKTNQEGYTWV